MKSKDYCYEHPRPALSTDCVIFGFDDTNLNVLLIERGGDPFKGYWALPGGFVQIDESAEDSAMRELFEETGIKDVSLDQLHTFTDVHRHPHSRVITIAYYGLVRTTGLRLIAGDDARNARWVNINDIPSLAFDHNLIISIAKKRLRQIIMHSPGESDLTNGQITVSELHLILETIQEKD